MRGDLAAPEDVFSWVESFTNLEKGNLPFDKRNYRLDRMRRLLGMFDDPDRELSAIHVAGTKGKGSTAALIASVLHAAGNRTGLYTSPHVSSPFERISLVGEAPRKELLVRLGREVKSALDALPAEGMPGHFAPTTFELYTLLALLYFRDAGCEHAVIEVGIGGRLDATNVIMPRASVITPLDLEHTDVLGDTLEKIAAEKAGIIKPGVPVFIGLQPPGLKDVFRGIGRERGSTVTFLDEETEELTTAVDAGGTSFTVRLRGEEREELRLSMLGEFQAENAALAYLTLRRMMPEIPIECFREGFRRTTLPGRMEVRGSAPAIVLDGAHTPLAVTRLLSSFRAIFPGEAILLFGSVSGKRPREMAAILAPAFSRVIISTPGTFKESDPEEVARIFRGFNPATILEKDPGRALSRARMESGGTRPILVTGSFYMIGEIGEAAVSEPILDGAHILLNGRLKVETGDITRQKVDVIVNAANSGLMGGGGVDGAIHRAGGLAILDACRVVRREKYPDGLPAGQAVQTTAGRLAARYVIHTVGPVWHGGTGGEPETLASCYRTSLELGERLGAQSIAFPAISTGVYGYPRAAAAHVVWETLSAYCRENPAPRTIVLVYYSADDARVFLAETG